MSKPFIRETKGFSLVELAIIVLITGIIASISIPLYLGYRKKAITIEASTNLIALYRYEINYFAEHDEFASDLSALGFSPQSNKYYEYEITESSQTGFTARASANIDNDPVLDVWTLNDSQVLIHATKD
ncbi:MAG: hypothetical protein A3C43_08345 [Candidatus Schekmanbacteria bacterium RIFCSPHIGHO2_02_FULL_38_11]|nr:MAG: hypothetical protein A3C43_08345 [Candidatus Schekmanbacteria bacterium RIFCSPHIGHO2_02_FULL_38_11]